MKTNLKFIMIALFTIALTVACSPEDGKDGTNGEQGIPGQDGNANVKTFIFENIALSTGDENLFLLSALTQDIVDNGVVLGYLSNTNTYWFPMPYIDGGETLSIFYVTEGSLVVSSTTDTGELNFKFVLIDGTPGDGSKVTGKSSKDAIYDELKTAGVDINDYDALVNYYNSKK